MNTEIYKTSRRRFLKGMAAAGTAAALTGCGGGGDSDSYTIGDPGSYEPETPVEEKIFSGSMGNNCGGKCIVRAHVANGAIRRLTTDETPESESSGNEMFKPQRRACLRCRGKARELYKTDRLRYPLKQTLERGDVSGFVRISWQQAFEEIALKLKASTAKQYAGTDPWFNASPQKENYGRGTIFAPFGGGPTHAMASYSFATKIAQCVGGTFPYNGTAMSYPQTNHVDSFMHLNNTYGYLITESNSRSDMFNCEQLVLWGFNPADSIMDTNTTYLLIQAKERGIPITVIDPHVSRTSRMMGGKHLAPIGGTDPALVFAILYHLIKLQLNESPITNGRWLDFDFIKRAAHGFFDLPSPTAADFYMGFGAAMFAPANYKVRPGTSLSAYILGNETDLVTAGLNNAPSIYPETIAYNVNSAANSPDGTADPLYDKRIPIYGQLPKTPEWAEMITGVPAQDIRTFAEMLASHERVGIFTGWGSNRTVEGEQSTWAVNSLAIVLGCWGRNGKFWGSPHMPASYAAISALPNVRDVSPAVTASSGVIGTTIINRNRFNSAKMSNVNPVISGNHGQICAWPDAVANGGSGKSFWNDPAVKYNTPIRSFFMAGFNPINQTGDNKRSMDIMKDPALLDLAVSLDIFMSPSAQHADYVLPATMPFETDSFTYSKSAFICVPKVIDPPGECLDDYRIVEGILKKVDNAYEEEVFQYRSPSEFLKTAFDGFKAATGVDTTFEEFKEKGYIDISQRSLEMANVNPAFKAYRDLVDTGSGSTGFLTATGKFDIYSQSMVEYYESRRWYNFDNDASRYPGYTAADLRLKHIGNTFDGVTTVEGIYTKACTYNNNHLDIPTDPAYSSFTLNAASAPEQAANMESARFVYPIPMYIPLIEGCHACDGRAQSDYPAGYPPIEDMRHPDPLGLRASYPYVVGSHHSIYRAHSSTDNSPLATEVYKLNGMGGSAFRDPDIGKGTVTAGLGVLPAELGVYEPLNISPHDASALDIQTGNVILVTSPRASVLMCANVTGIVRKGITHMAEGAWSTFKYCRITFADGSSEVLNVDIAGSANSLSTQRPSRICQGSGYCAYQRINIRKVASVETV